MHKTNKPDIYDLYTDSKLYGIAYIPTLKASKKIRKLFENREEMVFKCQYSIDYKKWIPISEAETEKIDTYSTIKKLEEKYNESED